MPLHPLFLQILLLYLLEAYLGRLFYLHLLKTALFLNEELEQVLKGRDELFIHFDVFYLFVLWLFSGKDFLGGVGLLFLLLDESVLELFVFFAEGRFEAFEIGDGVLVVPDHLFVGAAVANVHSVSVPLYAGRQV